jgi:hypothetical protein
MPVLAYYVGKNHVTTIPLFLYKELCAMKWGIYMSKYGNFLLLFLFVLSVIVNVYYTVIYTASTCVQFLTLITIFSLLKHL